MTFINTLKWLTTAAVILLVGAAINMIGRDYNVEIIDKIGLAILIIGVLVLFVTFAFMLFHKESIRNED